MNPDCTNAPEAPETKTQRKKRLAREFNEQRDKQASNTKAVTTPPSRDMKNLALIHAALSGGIIGIKQEGEQA